MPTSVPVKISLDRKDALLGLLSCLTSLAIYAKTVYPGVLPGDSGEFQVLAYQLGMAHTTGYPVYLLLAKLFTFLPVGTIAYRVNLFSAFMGALTIGAVYIAGRLLSARRWAGLLVALALAFSFTLWSQSLIAEVYTAGAFFIASVLACMLYWHRGGSRNWLFLAGLFGGVGLGTHSAVALFAPAVLVYLLLDRARWKTAWKPALLGAGLGVFLFLAAFVFVDLRESPANIYNAAYAPGRSSWDLSEADVNNPLKRIAFIMFAGQWRSAMLRWRVFWGHLGEYLANFWREFSPLVLVWVIWGWRQVWNTDRRVGSMIGLGLLFQWLFNFTYQIGDIYAFYIPSYIMLAMLGAVGAIGFSEWIIEKTAPMRYGLKVGISILVVILAMPLPFYTSLEDVIQSSPPFKNSDGYPVYDNVELVYLSAAKTVEKLPDRTILFTDWNSLYPYYYAAHIEQNRLDLQFIETFARSDKGGLPASILAFMKEKADDHVILVADSNTPVWIVGLELKKRYVGFLEFYQVVKK